MLTVRRDLLSQRALSGMRTEPSTRRPAPTETAKSLSARSGVDQPKIGVRSARRRRRRRRFREMMAVLVVLVALLTATVVILGLQWLDSPSGSGGTHPAHTGLNHSLTLNLASQALR